MRSASCVPAFNLDSDWLPILVVSELACPASLWSALPMEAGKAIKN